MSIDKTLSTLNLLRSNALDLRLFLKDEKKTQSIHNHTAVLDSEGQVWTFGPGSEGQLGHGNTKNQTLPKMIKAFKGMKIVQVSCGLMHTAFVTSNGEVFTCGYGFKARLGDGDGTDHCTLTPKMITCLKVFIKQVSCGTGHTGFLDSKGKVWTVGAGNFGQLGHGDTENQLEPKMIDDFDINIKQISCGGNHSAILDFEGRAWTFGKGENGRLGHGDDVDQLKPKMVVGIQGIKKVVCDKNHTSFIV